MLQDSFRSVAPLKWNARTLCLACLKLTLRGLASKHSKELFELKRIDLIAIDAKLQSNAFGFFGMSGDGTGSSFAKTNAFKLQKRPIGSPDTPGPSPEEGVKINDAVQDLQAVLEASAAARRKKKPRIPQAPVGFAGFGAPIEGIKRPHGQMS